MEAMFDRGWSDGLPIVPPTEARVLRMLDGTERRPEEIVAVVPPALVEVTVEQVAVNAVMAGCRPEYLPVVLAAVEAACTDRFNMHGLLCTLWFSGPVIVVNGPIRNEIGMSATFNAAGPSDRASTTIGRSVRLILGNLLDVRPGGIDRSTFGHPGKISFCIAEDEEGSPWEPLAAERGVPGGASAVTDSRIAAMLPLPASSVARLAATSTVTLPSKLVLGVMVAV